MHAYVRVRVRVCAPDPGGRGWTASMCTPALKGKGKHRQPGGGTLGRRESKVGSARLTPTQGRKRKSFISFPGALHSHRHTSSLGTCSDGRMGRSSPPSSRWHGVGGQVWGRKFLIGRVALASSWCKELHASRSWMVPYGNVARPIYLVPGPAPLSVSAPGAAA